jgi:hypothetical protein
MERDGGQPSSPRANLTAPKRSSVPKCRPQRRDAQSRVEEMTRGVMARRMAKSTSRPFSVKSHAPSSLSTKYRTAASARRRCVGSSPSAAIDPAASCCASTTCERSIVSLDTASNEEAAHVCAHRLERSLQGNSCSCSSSKRDAAASETSVRMLGVFDGRASQSCAMRSSPPSRALRFHALHATLFLEGGSPSSASILSCASGPSETSPLS